MNEETKELQGTKAIMEEATSTESAVSEKNVKPDGVSIDIQNIAEKAEENETLEPVKSDNIVAIKDDKKEKDAKNKDKKKKDKTKKDSKDKKDKKKHKGKKNR